MTEYYVSLFPTVDGSVNCSVVAVDMITTFIQEPEPLIWGWSLSARMIAEGLEANVTLIGFYGPGSIDGALQLARTLYDHCPAGKRKLTQNIEGEYIDLDTDEGGCGG